MTNNKPTQTDILEIIFVKLGGNEKNPEVAKAIFDLFVIDQEATKQEYDSLITVLEEYQKLLCDELDELIAFAHIRGWKSTRIEQGKEMRCKIQELKNQINNKQDEKN